MSWDLLCLKPKENTHSNRLWQAVTKQAWNPRKIPTKIGPNKLEPTEQENQGKYQSKQAPIAKTN
jgi:hypothetical protein